ncbi:hypothetical protein ACJJTC_001928 [Scirpophaga incertulas]
MLVILHVLIITLTFAVQNDAARILAVFPLPVISHQSIYRTLTLELLKKGHDVVVITADPMFTREERTGNLTEIDVHDVSYRLWQDEFKETEIAETNKEDWKKQRETMLQLLLKLFEQQLKHHDIRDIIKGKTKKFDLLIHEAIFPAALLFSHVLKVPVVQINSIGTVTEQSKKVGGPAHPFLKSGLPDQKIFDLTHWEYLKEVYNHARTDFTFLEYETQINNLMKKVAGVHTPSVRDLRDNVAIVLLNGQPVWDMNRPVPPNMAFMENGQKKIETKLPADIQKFLDSSKNGAIYISFGTKVEQSLLPPQKVETIVNVLSKLPYNIIWKWDKDELPGQTDNIKIWHSVPEFEILKHPNMKLFITQGGLQSTDQGIKAGIPLLGIPLLSDQKYNVDQYIHHGMGLGVDIETFDENILRNTISEIITNINYRQNILRLRAMMHEHPQSPLDVAIWWIDYVLKHGTIVYRSTGVDVNWEQLVEIKEVSHYLLIFVTFICIVAFILYICINKKTKTNEEYRNYKLR